jgi:hypothetical protein
VGRVPTVLAVLTDEEDVAFLDLHVGFLRSLSLARSVPPARRAAAPEAAGLT